MGFKRRALGQLMLLQLLDLIVPLIEFVNAVHFTLPSRTIKNQFVPSHLPVASLSTNPSLHSQ